ncbi:enzymatic polyprotein, putative [Rhizophagus clarus]|uniref:Enzymatic polyprotein, putative n=1 Tax=Rhizophagus clarus TaxID=94130 RepID=A0A8H3QCW1_9GLOM|nr:enzymatic polyprotein, putative [Rhizophagus clarus]
MPKCTHDVRAMLGLCSYYRKFIKDFAKTARPLIKLVKKEEAIGKCNARGHKKSCRKVEWKKEYEETFELLKEKLMNYPILQHPNFEKEYILMTDISGYGLGAVLAQLNEENKEIVIAYASKTLNETQMKYGITELECLAVIWAVQHFHKFLAGRKFRVVTDYAALKGLMNTKVTKGKRARWVMELQQYDFEIVYRAGKENKNVDTLSRLISENDINTKEFYNDKLSD